MRSKECVQTEKLLFLYAFYTVLVLINGTEQVEWASDDDDLNEKLLPFCLVFNSDKGPLTTQGNLFPGYFLWWKEKRKKRSMHSKWQDNWTWNRFAQHTEEKKIEKKKKRRKYSYNFIHSPQLNPVLKLKRQTNSNALKVASDYMSMDSVVTIWICRSDGIGIYSAFAGFVLCCCHFVINEIRLQVIKGLFCILSNIIIHASRPPSDRKIIENLLVYGLLLENCARNHNCLNFSDC